MIFYHFCKIFVPISEEPTLTAKVISWQSVTHMCFFTPVLTQLSFQSHRLLFSHASATVRCENTPKRELASSGYRTHNHQVMSPTRSPLSHPGRPHRTIVLQRGALSTFELHYTMHDIT